MTIWLHAFVFATAADRAAGDAALERGLAECPEPTFEFNGTTWTNVPGELTLRPFEGADESYDYTFGTEVSGYKAERSLSAVVARGATSVELQYTVIEREVSSLDRTVVHTIVDQMAQRMLDHRAGPT